MQHGHVGGGGFFVACGDAAEVFDFVDETFDEVSFLVKFGVVRHGLRPRRVGGDHRRHPGAVEVGAEAVRVIGGVGDQGLARQSSDQPLGLGDVAHLAAGEDEPQGIAQAIDGDVDFARQAAARAADGLSLSPPFAPAAC